VIWAKARVCGDLIRPCYFGSTVLIILIFCVIWRIVRLPLYSIFNSLSVTSAAIPSSYIEFCDTRIATVARGLVQEWLISYVERMSP
jgi:hypothetical protein